MPNLKPAKPAHPISSPNLKAQGLNTRCINQVANNLDRMGCILGGLLVLGPVFLSLLSSSPHQPKSLPISAKALVANQVIELEVARTPQQQAVGLMYRTELPPNRGMLFLFYPPQTVNFWMKNVQIHLDILFLKDGEIKAIRKGAHAERTLPTSLPAKLTLVQLTDQEFPSIRCWSCPEVRWRS